MDKGFEVIEGGRDDSLRLRNMTKEALISLLQDPNEGPQLAWRLASTYLKSEGTLGAAGKSEFLTKLGFALGQLQYPQEDVIEMAKKNGKGILGKSAKIILDSRFRENDRRGICPTLSIHH